LVPGRAWRSVESHIGSDNIEQIKFCNFNARLLICAWRDPRRSRDFLKKNEDRFVA
jgi:hypothetical protein